MPVMLGAVGYAVRFTDQPDEVLGSAGSFLGTRPVEHNLILTLLEARQARPEPGRYWIVEHDDDVVGVVFQSQVDARLALDELWLWETDRRVSMAAHRKPVAGIARIGPVYTPPSERRHGYAAACVGVLSQVLTERGCRCILYAELANPVSNAVYHRLGYRAAIETLRYRFDARD